MTVSQRAKTTTSKICEIGVIAVCPKEFQWTTVRAKTKTRLMQGSISIIL